MSPGWAGGLWVSFPSPAMTETTTSPGLAGRASTGFVLRAIPTRPSRSAAANIACTSAASAATETRHASTMIRTATAKLPGRMATCHRSK